MDNIRSCLAFAKEHFKDRNDLKCVEIGVFSGNYTQTIASVLNPALMIGIDIWEGAGETDQTQANNYMKTYFNLLGKSNVITIKGDSPFVAMLFRDRFFDFVYIDGNHCYLEFKADVIAWFSKVKKNGILGGHDYGQVKQFLTEKWDDKAIQVDSDNMDWWFK